VEKKKKGNKGLKVIIVILILALLGCIGYICYDKGIIKLPKKETKEEVKKKDKNDNKLSQNELDDIMDFAKELSNNFAAYYPMEEKDFSKIDNQDLLYWTLKRIGFKESITEKEIEAEVGKYFGNIEVKHEDIECPTDDEEPLYLHEDGRYVPNPNHFGHGSSSNPSAALFYLSSEKKNNEITVNYKILYSNTCNDTCILNAYYRKYEDAVKGFNPVLEGDPDSPDGPGVNLTDDIFKTVEVQVPVTTFKIEKTNKGYLLKSVSIGE